MTMQMTRTWRTAFVEEPARIAIGQPHQLFLSGMSVTFTAAFFYDALHKLPFLHPVVAGIIAVAGAIGAEYAYLKGLADGGTTRSPWQSGLIWTVFGLLVISGTLVMLRYAYPVPGLVNPSQTMAAVLTLAHIVPLALLGLCSAKLHAEAEQRHAAEAAQRHAEQRERAKRLEVEEEARQARLQAARDAAEAKRLEAQAEIDALKARAMARIEVRTAAAQQPAQTPAESPHAAAQRQMTREELYAAVRAAHEADPQFSRADMARRSGWSEAMVRKAIKDTTE
jgi:Skp family chaperone for outer membrane proteins